jgi:hypothetical protein
MNHLLAFGLAMGRRDPSCGDMSPELSLGISLLTLAAWSMHIYAVFPH